MNKRDTKTDYHIYQLAKQCNDNDSKQNTNVSSYLINFIQQLVYGKV